MDFDSDSLEQHLPYYLSAEDKNVLLDELKSISDGKQVAYLLTDENGLPSDTLQGDGWRGFKLFAFPDGKPVDVSGLVLSNSCDIDPANRRDLPTRITFSPLVKLSAFESVLSKSGLDESKIRSKFDAIRSQKVTNIFFIPAGGSLSEDYIVRLDDVHSMPFSTFSERASERIFIMSNTGFYMLIFKLSVHFCRLQENVRRSNAA